MINYCYSYQQQQNLNYFYVLYFLWKNSKIDLVKFVIPQLSLSVYLDTTYFDENWKLIAKNTITK